MKQKIANCEGKMQNLISMAFGLEMVKNLLEQSVRDGDGRKELERISREIKQIDRRIGRLM